MRTIAHISDLHFGTHSEAVVEALLAALAAAGPDLVVVSGDLTQRARPAEFAAAKAFLDRLPARWLAIPGNHDIPLYDAFTRLFSPFGRYRRFIKGGSAADDVFFADDEIAVFGLNTVRRLKSKNGRVAHEQVAEIRRLFGAAGPAPLRILVTHHPISLPPDILPVHLVHRSELALAAVDEAGVRVLLSGHYHQSASGGFVDAKRAADGQVLLVHAGTAISSRTRTDGNAFNLIRSAPPTFGVTVMAYGEGVGFVARGTKEYRDDGHRWTRPAGSPAL